MTERLYYTDPYQTRFAARVVERLSWDGHTAVVLDRTAFYPTSGGQPSDRGTLGDAEVVDVVERENDRAVVHVLTSPIEADEVVGWVDWRRRFDHMQQHTGQHILSAAFAQVLGGATVGFHLGESSSTVDVDLPDLDWNDVLPVETLANQVVWDDRPIRVRFVDREALAARSAVAAPDIEGPLRLIEIPGGSRAATGRFDVNPCGGTHVRRTGEIGMVKLAGLEHRGETTRVEFLCGGRALRDYEAKRRVASTVASRLTVGTWELDEAVERLQEENKQLRRSERRLREQLLHLEAHQMVAQASRHGPYRVVGAVWQDRAPDDVRALAREVAEHEDTVALLFAVAERTHFCFARAENLDLDVNLLVQEACSRLEGKGGGRPHVAQGSAPAVSVERALHVLRALQAALE